MFVNDVVALYVVSRSRGSKVPQALLGPDFDGVVISDFFSAYSPLEVEKAKCWAHLLRDSHDYAKGQDADSERTRFHRRLHGLFVEMGLALEQVQADEAGRQRVYEEMREKLWRFATEHWRTWQCQQLAERIKKYLDDLVVWLSNPAVDPTGYPLGERGGTGVAWGGRDAQNLLRQSLEAGRACLCVPALDHHDLGTPGQRLLDDCASGPR